jgi:hypothetical protein
VASLFPYQETVVKRIDEAALDKVVKDELARQGVDGAVVKLEILQPATTGAGIAGILADILREAVGDCPCPKCTAKRAAEAGKGEPEKAADPTAVPLVASANELEELRAFKARVTGAVAGTAA